MRNFVDSVLQALRRLTSKVIIRKLWIRTGFWMTGHALSMTIISQPLPQTDCYGNHVEFSVTISGAVGTVDYQWQQKPPGGNFSDITGANSALLNIDNIGVNKQNVNGTEYRVLITDDNGTIISDSALLTVNSITDLTPAVVNSTICSGGIMIYKVSAEGNLINIGYQWSWNNGTGWTALSDGGAYTGTSTAQLTISNATTAQNGSYRVSVTFATLNQPPADPTCVETSFTRERNLVVRDILSPPVAAASQQICYGSTPSPITATPASGGSGPNYTYQWQSSYDGSKYADVPGADKLSYSPPALMISTFYRINATDAGTPHCGTVSSGPVLISVNQLPATSPIYHR
jgi:hypothetical protein